MRFINRTLINKATSLFIMFIPSSTLLFSMFPSPEIAKLFPIFYFQILTIFQSLLKSYLLHEASLNCSVLLFFFSFLGPQLLLTFKFVLNRL